MKVVSPEEGTRSAWPGEGVSGRVIAAGVPGMAAANPKDSLAQPPEQAVLPESLDHVPATARLEPAGLAEHRAEGVLIDPDRPDQEPDRDS